MKTQAVQEKTSLKLVKNTNEKFSEDMVYSLLKVAENADPKMKSDLENKIVAYGEVAIPALIKTVMSIKGTSRGIAAMSLIRIGFASIEPLKNTALENKEFMWIAEYLTREIEGSKESLSSKQALVC